MELLGSKWTDFHEKGIQTFLLILENIFLIKSYNYNNEYLT